MEEARPLEAGVRYRIDDRDTIVFVDDSWRRFAEANHGQELEPGQVLGRPLWDFICDETTRHLYRKLLARARTGEELRFPLRCDGPTCRRHLEMAIRRVAPDTVEFETTTLLLEEREPVALLDPSSARSSRMLRACAWCNRIATDDGAWLETEDAVREMGLFENAAVPQLTHGICDRCLEGIEGRLSRG